VSDLLETFVANCEQNGLIVHRGVVPEIGGAEISTALYGLADPGSVVIACSPEEPRARSLLPDVHIAVIREDQVLPDLAALLAAVRSRLPSSLAIVSGPSSTGDIEMTHAVGVHGPREQHIALLAPE
jgi:L-lactate dehydrogenase complex protein LldG